MTKIFPGTCRATCAELRKIDEALAAVRRGEVATFDEVEAVFAKHRRQSEERPWISLRSIQATAGARYDL